MKSLMIQDAFEPYYSDRKRFPNKPLPVVSAIKEKGPAPQDTRQAKPITEADKTMEH
jgi:hypothetical protein